MEKNKTIGGLRYNSNDIWHSSDTVVSVLGRQDDSATSLLDLLLGKLADKLGLDYNWDVRQATVAEHLEDTVLRYVNDGGLAAALGFLCLGLLKCRSRYQRPQLLHVDRWAVVLLLGLAKVSHTDLAKVSRVEAIEQDAVVVLATGVTATTRVLAVLACKEA